MKIKLKQGFTADNHEHVYELTTISDIPTTLVVLAGRKHKTDNSLSSAESIRVWCGLAQKEFDRIAWDDYVDIIMPAYNAMFQTSEEAAEESDAPKAIKRKTA